MASATYYYLFSIILVITTLFYCVNLILLRISGKTTFGVKYRPGTTEYGMVVKLASNRNITIVAVLSLLLVGNLVYSIIRLRHVNTSDSRFILIFAPFFTALLSVLIMFAIRKQLYYSPSKK
jgi:drug/metabolite transporter (DMT)-like permease